MPRSKAAVSYGSPIFSFLRDLYTVLHSSYIKLYPPSKVGGFPFLHPPPSFLVCRLFDDGHSDQCEVITHCSSDLHFSNN